MSCNDRVKKATDYLVYCISRRIPFAELIYNSVELSDEIPDVVKEEDSFVTDGIKLYVRNSILEKYHMNRMALETELLHELLHIYMGHPVMAKKKDRMMYDLKCDNKVEAWIKKSYFGTNRFFEKENSKHILWYEQNSQGNSEKGIASASATMSDADHASEGDKTSGSDKMADNREKIQKEIWQNIQFLVDMTMNSLEKKFDFEWGNGDGTGGTSSGIGTAEPDSYIDILKKYVAVKEQTCTTDEEIDTILYTYGLDLYGDVTLIEPPEETESIMAKFYLAVDTSGSCVGEMVEKFLGQTKGVLEELSFDGKKKLDIYLFLCDTRIEQEFHITDISQFPNEEEWIISGGGTSFIPVFERVKELQCQYGENANTALFYYTDGCGNCPKEEPEYDVYFLMEKRDIEFFNGPEWIKRVQI